MNTKRIILSTVLTTANFVSVHAEDVTAVKITSYVKPSYSVRIPADTEISYGEETTDLGSVEVVSACLEPDQCISVTAETDGFLVNEKSDTSMIPFSLISDGIPYSGSEFTEAYESNDLQLLVDSESWEKADAGRYEGKIIFRVKCAEKESEKM